MVRGVPSAHTDIACAQTKHAVVRDTHARTHMCTCMRMCAHNVPKAREEMCPRGSETDGRVSSIDVSCEYTCFLHIPSVNRVSSN